MSEQSTFYAVSESTSRRRRFAEAPHPYRSGFERDRDRIMHSSAFRLLEGKTQVFTPGVNDHYRTRLTHSIEVAQIGRTVARVLGLNENLAEAICLGHDLGHSPFGHNGEKVLNTLMSGFGGFEHNRQSLRIVDLLEHPYPDFAGLNLMYETRLGFARHQSPYDKSAVDDFDESNGSLEGQVADIADRIAYNCHDLEDGLRAELISEDMLKSLKLFAEAQDKINANAIEQTSVRRTRTVKTIIDNLVSDCLKASKESLEHSEIKTLEQVYSAPESFIVLSRDGQRELGQLEKFLLDNMYMHPELIKTSEQIETWLTELFEKFRIKPDLMPQHYRQLISAEGLERTVCDYIAGMTDRFCISILGEI